VQVLAPDARGDAAGGQHREAAEIAPAQKGPTAFLPFTKAFVPTVDIAGKRIVAAPPDDLFEPAKPAPEDEA